MDESQNWYLLKHDDATVFGPVTFEQPKQWAVEAQVSPLDKVSTDQQTWSRPALNPDAVVDRHSQGRPDTR